MAASDAQHSPPAAKPESMLAHGRNHVLATGGMIAADRAEPGTHKQLISPNGQNQRLGRQPSDDFHGRVGEPYRCCHDRSAAIRGADAASCRSFDRGSIFEQPGQRAGPAMLAVRRSGGISGPRGMTIRSTPSGVTVATAERLHAAVVSSDCGRRPRRLCAKPTDPAADAAIRWALRRQSASHRQPRPGARRRGRNRPDVSHGTEVKTARTSRSRPWLVEVGG